jgi:hypothetical protein
MLFSERLGLFQVPVAINSDYPRAFSSSPSQKSLHFLPIELLFSPFEVFNLTN